MRLFLDAFGAALFLATPAIACQGVMPPKWALGTPSVPYEIFHMRAAQAAHACRSPGSWGCAYPAPTHKQPNRWAVILNDDVPEGEVWCTLEYEIAHMPPFYWGDPKVETAETMKAYGLSSSARR